MYQLFRHGIFQMDAEKAHNFTIQCLKLAGNPLFQPILKSLIYAPKGFPKTVMGVNFPNPIGLAAGADKNGDAINGFGTLGFGFLEEEQSRPLHKMGMQSHVSFV